MATQHPCHLPVELWIEVFKQVPRPLHLSDAEYRIWKDDSLATFLSLALVCQLFRHLSQPFIFFRFDIDRSFSTGYAEELDKAQKRMEGLLAVLKEKPYYRQWFKTLRFNFRRRRQLRLRYSYLPNRIVQVERLAEEIFLQLIDLRSLSLSNMYFSPNMQSHICGFPSLQTVRLEVAHPLIPPFGPAFLPKWQDLSIRSHMESLNVALRVLVSNYPLGASISWPSVTDLTLSVDIDGDHLSWVLAAFPSLRRLTFSYVPGDAHFAPFQEDCISALTDFSGPWRVACSVIPGRPIRKASLQLESGLQLSRAEMAFLSQGTAKLEHLQLTNVRASSDHLKLIAALLPDLKSLSLSYVYRSVHHCLTFLTGFVSAECTMPRLEHLCCNTIHAGQFPPGDEEFLKWLQSSATAFPSLHTADLQGNSWLRDPGDAWEWHRDRSY